MPDGNAVPTRYVYGTFGPCKVRADHKPDTPASVMRELGACVYFIHTADGLIKIGYTTNLGQRLRAYKGGLKRILFAVRGTYDDEQILHARFRPFRARGVEYYHPVPEILDYIDALREARNIPPLKRKHTQEVE